MSLRAVLGWREVKFFDNREDLVMLRSLMSLKNYRLEARDGEIGSVNDIYFDDERWTVRYLVVNTDVWLPGGNVLIPMAAVGGTPDWVKKHIPVELTKEQVKASPAVSTHKPVSREEETKLNVYYGYPSYWTAFGPAPAMIQPLKEPTTKSNEASRRDSHLRSLNEVTGYYIKAKDKTFGHVEDLIVDDEKWALRYMVIDTKNWIPAKEVLIAPSWASEIKWDEKMVSVDLTEEQLKASPEYRPSDPINREQEERLYDYYGRPRYWEQDHVAGAGPIF
ncbi:MAG: PRC-barrel domain-containing protein [Bdellovibrionales bacterium]|nr:PRC-barrel domain-containing protein [Bdellovibrionales bacterium]